MNLEITGFTLNGRFFKRSEIVRYCTNEIETKDAPLWKLDVYQFIVDFLGDSEFIYQKTSGTTGVPKTVELSKIAMIESAKRTGVFFGLKPSDTAVLCLPVNYIAGKMMIVRALCRGLDLITIEPAGTPDFSGLGEIDFCAMVPMQATNLIQQSSWPSIKKLILGGAEPGKALVEQLQEYTTEVFETYGMAETCSHVALKPLAALKGEEFFTALPGIEFLVDERDCLIVDAPFLPGKIKTNDCVKLFAKDKFQWLGRIDNVINSGGIKIQPEELEKQFQEILLLPCAVVGKPDPLLGQKLVLVLESVKETDLSQVITQLAPHIDKKYLPKSIYCMSELPRNQSHKIDRIKLSSMV